MKKCNILLAFILLSSVCSVYAIDTKNDYSSASTLDDNDTELMEGDYVFMALWENANDKRIILYDNEYSLAFDYIVENYNLNLEKGQHIKSFSIKVDDSHAGEPGSAQLYYIDANSIELGDDIAEPAPLVPSSNDRIGNLINYYVAFQNVKVTNNKSFNMMEVTLPNGDKSLVMNESDFIPEEGVYDELDCVVLYSGVVGLTKLFCMGAKVAQGIDGITGDNTSENSYFDLIGRPIDIRTHHGVAIRYGGNKVEKILNK